MLHQYTKIVQESDKKLSPISLLPIFSKIVKSLIFNDMFNYLDKIIFLQSFKLVLFKETPVLLNYYQLPIKFTKVLILGQREILRRVFCDISKAFDEFCMNFYFLNCSLVEQRECFEIFKKFLDSVSTKSCFKRTNVIVAKCNWRCSTRFCFRTSFIFYLYK